MTTTTKIAYSNNTAIVMTCTGLAADAGLLVGRQSVVQDNTSNLYLDCIVRGSFTVGTTPAITGGLAVFVYGADTSPASTAIGPINGTDASCTFTTTSLGASVTFARKPSVLVNTSDTKYYIQPFSVAMLFGGVMPKFWGLYVAHDMTAALKTDAANNDSFSFNGINYTHA